MQVDDLIGDGSCPFEHHGNQGGVASFILEFGEVGGSHLAAFTGDLQQAVLVDRMAEPFR